MAFRVLGVPRHGRYTTAEGRLTDMQSVGLGRMVCQLIDGPFCG